MRAPCIAGRKNKQENTMGKKIVVISSSPRVGGNSDTLCDQFVKGAAEAGHAVEKVNLAELRVNPCRGCYACRDSQRCVQDDDARLVIDKMMNADIIVLASPVYFYSISAQLKALFDRTVVIFPHLPNKKFYYILTMADDDTSKFSGPLTALRGFLECYDGSEEAGMVCCAGVYDFGEAKNTPEFAKAYEMGRNIR